MYQFTELPKKIGSWKKYLPTWKNLPLYPCVKYCATLSDLNLLIFLFSGGPPPPTSRPSNNGGFNAMMNNPSSQSNGFPNQMSFDRSVSTFDTSR